MSHHVSMRMVATKVVDVSAKLLVDDAGRVVCSEHVSPDGRWHEMRTSERVDLHAELGRAPTCCVCDAVAQRAKAVAS